MNTLLRLPQVLQLLFPAWTCLAVRRDVGRQSLQVVLEVSDKKANSVRDPIELLDMLANRTMVRRRMVGRYRMGKGWKCDGR